MTWETEDLSDAQSQSQMTTDTYGYGDGGDQKIIWSDDPESAYFRSMVQGKEDNSLIGGLTRNEKMEGRTRISSQGDDQKMPGALSRRNGSEMIGSSGLSYDDTDAEDDTIAKIEADVDDHGWFAARRKKNKVTKKELDESLDNSTLGPPLVDPSLVPDMAYNFKSPISALSPLDKAGEGRGASQPFAVPNPNLVPKFPRNRPVAPVDGKEIMADLEGYGEDGKIIPGYIFVTQGHSSSVQTKNSPPNAKKMHTEATPKATSKARFSLGRQNPTSPLPQEAPAKYSKLELTVETDDSIERRRRRKLLLCKMGICFLMLALVVGIAMLALVLRARRNTKDLTQSNGSLPEESPPSMPPNYFLPSPGAPNATPTSPPVVDGTTSAPSITSPLETDAPSPDSTLMASTSYPVDTVKEFIISLFPLSETALEDTTSPQFRALEWIAEDIMDNRLLRGRQLQELDSEVIQRWTLAVFFFATGGDSVGNATAPSWISALGWLELPNECEWSFIVCNEAGRLTELSIEDNALTGTIPPEIGLFDSLVKLSLNSNAIEGELPTTLGLLSGLQDLSVHRNFLTGTLPTELGNLNALQGLALSRNLLDGTIPTQLGNLAMLRSIDLALTNLAGAIPTELGKMEQLELISLGSTNISGDIPSQMGDLPFLKRFKVGRTDLVGEIPVGICSRSSDFDEIRADCEELVCTCCTICCVDGGDCSEIAILTPSPTQFPSKMPSTAPSTQATTVVPTVRPTASATQATTAQPTLFPTATPVAATAAPTKTPTNNPTLRPTGLPAPTAPNPTDCTPGIVVDDDCYENGDDILVVFDNCNPRGDDWIGVYATGQDFAALGEPIAWVWTAGDQLNQTPVSSGNITFFDAQGTGNFQMILARNLGGPPYRARAVSSEFRLSRQCS